MFENAIKIDSNYIDAFLNLGDLYKDVKDYKKAIFFYDKVIDMNPYNIIASKNKEFLLKV